MTTSSTQLQAAAGVVLIVAGVLLSETGVGTALILAGSSVGLRARREDLAPRSVRA